MVKLNQENGRVKGVFVGLPLHGHTTPTLALVHALVRANHEVVYLSTDAFAPAIATTGARYLAYRSASLADMQSLPDRMEQLAWLLASTTADVLNDELDRVRAERPDYVIADSVAPWGTWIARILRIPIVTSVSTFAFNRHVLAYGMKHGVRPKSLAILVSKIRNLARATRVIRRLRARYGINGPGAMESVFGHSDLNIVYTSRYFQPCGDSFDSRYVFVGPSLAPETFTEAPAATRGTPLAYVSLGTLFNRDTELFTLLLDGVGATDVQAIVSAGGADVGSWPTQIPGNVDVRPWVEQVDILRQATVCVSHGGMNTVSESLAVGVPLVVIPAMSEQQVVGLRVEELGVGVCLDRRSLSSSRLRDAILQVVGDEGFRRRIAPVRESFREAGGLQRAVAAIETFVGCPMRREAGTIHRVTHS